jgi:hypothetical protein
MSQKISQFTQITTLASGDYFPVVQTSGTTNKAVQVGALDQRYFVAASGNLAQQTADQALASGNAALTSSTTALASGNAALSRAGGTMTGQIIFAAGQQINSSVNLSGGISGAVSYQSAPNATTFLNPGISGQVLATQGSNQFPTWITPGGGKILQVVQGTTTNAGSVTSSTFTSTGISVSITPSSTSSRVLIIGSVAWAQNGSGGLAMFTFLRAGTNLGGSDGFWYNNAGTRENVCFSYLDSPSTTSSTTYEIAARSANASTVSWGTGATRHSIILLEVGP